MQKTKPLAALLVSGTLLLGLGDSLIGQNRGYSEREVSFKNGSVVLSGTFITPDAEQPVPAVVFLHGSGPVTREGARQYAEQFAALGVASLFFDKRGSGTSTGSWVTSSLEDLAGDADAAIEFARTQPEVNPRRVGLWGVSQAAWVATLVAGRDPDVAFLMLISGGGASPRESELFSYGQAFERARLSSTERQKGFAAVEQYFAYLSSGEGRDSLVDLLSASTDEPWFAHARLDQILPDESNRVNWSWVADWDPSPFARRITCPVLLLFGDRDTDQPTNLAIQRWREDLELAGNESVTTVVFPGAGHGIRMGESHERRGPFADGYYDVMLGWLWRVVVAAR